MAQNKRKICIIGAGHVGSHAAYALVGQGLAAKIILIDTDGKKAQAQATDITDALAYLTTGTKISAGGYDEIEDAGILIVAAGPLPDMQGGQLDRMDTLGQSVAVIKEVVREIAASGFAGIIINITNPADVITHYIQNKLNWPAERIFSTSTTLDSARLRRVLAAETDVSVHSVQAYALGEHGESQMVPWSAVTIGGKPLLELMEKEPAKYGGLNLAQLALAGKQGGWNILGGKGSTEFGIGASIAAVVRAVVFDEKRIYPVSVLLSGEYGVQDTYASVPAVIGADGIEETIELSLTAEEREAFKLSCTTMQKNYEKALLL